MYHETDTKIGKKVDNNMKKYVAILNARYTLVEQKKLYIKYWAWKAKEVKGIWGQRGWTEKERLGRQDFFQ